MVHVVIIGAVAAGMSAASKLKRLDPSIFVTVFEQGEDVSYGACGLPYFLSDIIPDERLLIARKPEAFRAAGIDLRLGHTVRFVDVSARCVTVRVNKTGQEFKQDYDRLVIATGAQPIRLDVKRGDFANIHTLGSLQDGRVLKKALSDEAVKTIAVVGGGYIGLEVIENLHKLKKEIILIERADRVLTNFEPFISKKLEEHLVEHGVTVKTGETVRAYTDQGGRGIVETDQSTYTVDLVVEAIGVRPATSFLDGTEITRLPNGAIVTDARMQTSIENVYAAGDCAAYVHAVTGKPGSYVPLGTHANKAGRVIAEQIVGNDVTFAGVLGSGVLKVFDYEVARTGLGVEEAAAAGFSVETVSITAKDKAGYYPGAVEVEVAVIYDPLTCRLLGAQMIGQAGVAHRINIMATAISAGYNATQFSGLDLAYAPPFSPVYDPLLVAVNQIKCLEQEEKE